MENQRGYPPRSREQPRLNPRHVGGVRQSGGPGTHIANPNGSNFYGERRMRRRTRSSRSESQGSEEEEGMYYAEGYNPVYQGFRGETVWFNRNLYDQAEGQYQTWLGSGGGNPPMSSSPRDRTSRVLVFRSKRKNAQPYQNKEDDHYTYNPSYGVRQRHRGTAHYRSSSEPQKGRQGRKAGRKRGYSETDNTPQRDNIIMSGLQCLAQEKIWFDKSKYDEAERRYYEGLNGITHSPQVKTALQPGKGHSRSQKPRERKTSQNASSGAGDQSELVSRIKSLELDNKNLHKVVNDLRSMLSKLESRMAVLEKTPVSTAAPVTKAAPVQKVKVEEDEDEDDDIDLFGSDEDDEEAERIKAQRVKEYTERKAKKPALIAKSSILLDVKPWDDETDMAKMEECVRSVQMDGLVWGASKLVPVGYGIKKLQIQCVVEDDKVGTDMLEEEITQFEDYVQSVDVAAFNKI